jgi:type II secretion system protein G
MQRIYKQHRSSGFTLIELVIVIAILGILAGIAIPRLEAAQEEARGAKLLADIRTIESAANMYAGKNGTYPGTYDPWYAIPTNGNRQKAADYLAGTDFATGYFAAWPTPPSGYLRIKGNNGKIYRYKLTGPKNGAGDFNPYVWNHSSYLYQNKTMMPADRVIIGHSTVEDFLNGTVNTGFIQKEVLN